MSYRKNIRVECNAFVEGKNSKATEANKKKLLRLVRLHLMAIYGKRVI